MKSHLLLDVAELGLTHITGSSSVNFVDIDELYKDFAEGNTLCKTKATFSEFRTALVTVFPIYKNRRKHTKIIKLSSKTAYSECEKLSLKLRPIGHINRKR